MVRYMLEALHGIMILGDEGMTAQDSRSKTASGVDNAPRYDYMKDLNPVQLVKSVSADATDLVVDQITLAKKEAKKALGDLRSSLISVVLAAITLFAGTLFLMLSATSGLALVIPFWAASLCVGVLVSLLGFLLIVRAIKLASSDNLAPENTVRSVARDRDMVEKHV